jgi:hypothetical protein
MLLHLLQQQARQEAVVFRHPAVKGRARLRELGPQPAARQLGQFLGAFLTGDQRPQHVAAGGARHVGGHRAELDVGAPQQLLDAVGDRRLGRDQLPPLPGQGAAGRHGD